MVEADVGPEGALQCPDVEQARLADVLDAQDRSIAGHALHEIAETHDSRRERSEPRTEECLGDRDLLLELACLGDRARPGRDLRLRPQHLVERYDPVGDGTAARGRRAALTSMICAEGWGNVSAANGARSAQRTDQK
jgi:hypothetical protein